MPKRKSKPTPEQQTPEDHNRARLLRWAEDVMHDPDASTVDKSRAADVIFRATPGLATKPADPYAIGRANHRGDSKAHLRSRRTAAAVSIRYTLIGLPKGYSKTSVYANIGCFGDGTTASVVIPLTKAPFGAAVFSGSKYPTSAVVIGSVGTPLQSVSVDNQQQLNITFSASLYFESLSQVLVQFTY